MNERQPTSGSRLRRDAERNRERVLAAARRLFAETGLAVTHNEVARAAGVGVATVYRRFPDRESLMAALFEDQLTRVADLAASASACADPWTGLRTFLEGVLELQAADRGLQEHMLGAHGPARAAAAAERIAPAVAELLARAKERGQVRSDVHVQDVALIPVMVGAVTDRARTVRPDLWRRVLAVVLDGLRPGTPPLPGVALTPAESVAVLTAR